MANPMNLFAHLLGGGGMRDFDGPGLNRAVPRAGDFPPGFMGQSQYSDDANTGYDAPRMPGPQPDPRDVPGPGYFGGPDGSGGGGPG